MKKLNFSFLFLFSFLTFISCTKDDVSTENLENLGLSANKIATMLNPDQIDDLLSSEKMNSIITDNFKISEDVLLSDEQYNKPNRTISSNYFEIDMTMGMVNQSNLNDIYNIPTKNGILLSTTVFISSKGNKKGVIVHSYDSRKEVILLTVYTISPSNTLEKINGYPVIVNDILINDIVYIGNSFFPKNNVKTITVNDFSNYSLSKDYNDQFLRIIAESVFVSKEGKQNKHAFLEDGILTSRSTRGSCSMAVHFCQRGKGPRCTSLGCRDTCPIGDTDEQLNNDQKSIMDQVLPFENMYALEDILINTNRGESYVDFYYSIGDHFLETVNAEVLIDMVSIAPELGSAVTSFINNDSSEVVITQSLFSEINTFFQTSKANSSSQAYIDAIDLFLLDLSSYIGLNVSQVNIALNQN